MTLSRKVRSSETTTEESPSLSPEPTVTGPLRAAGDSRKTGRPATDEEMAAARALLDRARAAMTAIATYDQETVDRLCRAVAWATANEQTFDRLTRMSVEESGMGSADGVPARRWKILGILRDALRTRSVGIIEELPDKGIVKYAKPVGVIAGLLPVTNPLVTMVNMVICDQVQGGGNLLAATLRAARRARNRARLRRAAKQVRPRLILGLGKPSIPLAAGADRSAT